MLNIQHSHGKYTVLTLRVPDQAALRGILNKLWDLNLTLVSMESTEDELEPTNPAKPLERFGGGNASGSMNGSRKIQHWFR